jgi:hypothetical protein
MAPAPPGSQVAPLPDNLPFQLISKTIGQGAYASYVAELDSWRPETSSDTDRNPQHTKSHAPR